jgi:hypothetical protein
VQVQLEDDFWLSDIDNTLPGAGGAPDTDGVALDSNLLEYNDWAVRCAGGGNKGFVDRLRYRAGKTVFKHGPPSPGRSRRS